MGRKKQFKSCHICRMMCGVTIYLYKHRNKHALTNVPKQLIQSCMPLVIKQIAPSFHSDLVTR